MSESKDVVEGLALSSEIEAQIAEAAAAFGSAGQPAAEKYFRAVAEAGFARGYAKGRQAAMWQINQDFGRSLRESSGKEGKCGIMEQTHLDRGRPD